MNNKNTRAKRTIKQLQSFFAKNVSVSVDGAPVVKGVTMTVRPGEIHVLMGPNGSGKSTFLNALLGNPRYVLSRGTIKIGTKDLTSLPAFQRARAGLFLGFQEPVEIPGLHIGSFLHAAKNIINDARGTGGHLTPMEFSGLLKNALNALSMDERFAARALNDGFSGGEKKKSELLQMVMVHPSFAFLDEFDSGLDIDALKTACTVIRDLAKEQRTGFILVSHNPRILDVLCPTHAHIMLDGRIIQSGGPELVRMVEKGGFEQWGK